MSSFGKIKKGDIYEGEEFYEQPYTQTDKFNVYIPRQKENIIELIEKDQQKSLTQSQMQANRSQQQRPASQGSQSSFRNKLVNQVAENRDGQDPQTAQQQYLQQNELTKSQSSFRNKSQHIHGQRNYSHANLNSTNNSRLLKTSQGFRSTNFTPKSTGYTQKQDQLKKTQDRLRSRLYFDDKTRSIPKTTVKNKIIENIVQDPYPFLKNKQLMGSIFKLKELNLLRQQSIHVNQQAGVGKFDFVLNDFHSKATNPGYSRNNFGGFYTR